MRKGSVRSGLIRRGDYLYHGDKIITGQIGSASFIMIYEDTSIKLYNNSVARLLSERYSVLNHSELALFVGKVIIEVDDNIGYSFWNKFFSRIPRGSTLQWHRLCNFHCFRRFN